MKNRQTVTSEMELILWLTGGFLLFGGVTKADFERAAARDLKTVLRGDAQVRVTTRPNLATVGGTLPSAKIEASAFSANGLPLFTVPSLSQSGKLDRLVIQLREFDLRGLRVERLEALIPGCRFDLNLAINHKKIRLSRSGEGTGTVQIRARDLEQFVLKKYPAVKAIQMTLQNDRIRVVAEADLGNTRLKFSIDGRMESADGRSLRLVDPVAEINGSPASAASAKALANSINPVLHLDRDLGLYGAVDITTIKLDGNRLIATAATRIPASPAWVLARVRFF